MNDIGVAREADKLLMSQQMRNSMLRMACSSKVTVILQRPSMGPVWSGLCDVIDSIMLISRDSAGTSLAKGWVASERPAQSRLRQQSCAAPERKYSLQEATVSSCNSRPRGSGRFGHGKDRCLVAQEEILLHAASEQALDAGQVSSYTSSFTLDTLCQCLMDTVVQALLLNLANMYVSKAGAQARLPKGTPATWRLLASFVHLVVERPKLHGHVTPGNHCSLPHLTCRLAWW